MTRGGQRAGLICLAALGVTAASGCSAPSEGSHPTAAPADYCERNVTYWSGQLVSSQSDAALDYQEMGLSDAEYGIVREVVRAHEAAAAGSKRLTPIDVGRISALCQARRARSVTSPLPDKGRTWPTG